MNGFFPSSFFSQNSQKFWNWFLPIFFYWKKIQFSVFLVNFFRKIWNEMKTWKKLVSERCFWVFYCPLKSKKYWKKWKWKKKITNFEGFFEPFQCFYCILSNNGEEIYQWDLANFDCVLINLTKLMNRHWFMVMFHLYFNLYGCYCD